MNRHPHPERRARFLAARRSTLELELALTRFVEEYLAEPGSDAQALVAALDLDDPVLADVLAGHPVKTQGPAAVLERLRLFGRRTIAM